MPLPRSKGSRPGRTVGLGLLKAFVLILAGLAWGLAAASFHVFPYTLVEAAYRALAGSPGSLPSMRWRPARNGDDRRGHMSERLANLPYTSGSTEAPETTGVIGHDPDAAWDGVNLMVSGHAPQAVLFDMDGRVLHTWRRELDQVWPTLPDFGEYEEHKTFWRRAHVFPNGDLLAIFEGIGMIKLDKDSNLLWANQGRAHHDLFVDDDGDIYTLARAWRDEHERFALEGPIQEDFVLVLDGDGRQKRKVSLLDCFLDSDYYSLLYLAPKRGDVLHTNTIELLDGRFADRYPMLQRGRALVSVPTVNAIAVVDLETARTTWALAGMSSFQHQPTVLDDGRILLFDNNGYFGKSRVIEVDPLTQEVVWSYHGTEASPFFSKTLGSSQRLPNGNTLITESNAGRAFEVTPRGDIVWEFSSPYRAGDRNELIATLFEVVRIDREYFSDFPAR